ncbi:protein TBATA-like [Leucoraja erinacea]|uniref:protein TBATA-like n=1 Tax=Leucoraja erinaceus TaxID=7782 RepID=UPI0024547B83|nr:protein TBATA-like [Leucoraja erinacea]XP_055497206.1 protein TBATA-like [Leucoraja erinacea]
MSEDVMMPSMNFQVGPTSFRMNNFENEFRNEMSRSRNGLPLPLLNSGRPSTTNSCKYAADTSFYTRNNPHPKRVYHIKGLNNALVCKVDDDRVCDRLPARTAASKQDLSKYKRPITANIPTTPPYPAHIITGLPLAPCKDELQPDLNLLYSQAWRDALKDLTARVEFFGEPAKEDERWASPYSGERVSQCQSPSRPVSRSSPRPSSRAGSGEYVRPVLSTAEREILVLELLCQILQTDSIQAVQQWLLVTSLKDKEVVLDTIRMAVANMKLGNLNVPVGTMPKEGSCSRQASEEPEAIFRAPSACERRRARSQLQRLEAILEKDIDKNDLKVLETTKSPCPCARGTPPKAAKKPKALGTMRKVLNVPSSPIMEGKLCHSRTDLYKT